MEIRRETLMPRGSTLPGDRPTYAIGDVHGCYDLLHALLRAVGDDARARAGASPPLLIMCGDYIDRGPDSAKVLTALAWLSRSGGIEARLLEGNHEAMLRLFLDRPEEHGNWLDIDGRETLASYGVAVPEVIDNAGLAALRDTLLDVMPASHLALLGRLETIVEVGDYAFVHAGVRPGVSLGQQSRDDLLWIREPFLTHPRPADKVIVHGHTWQDDRPVVRPQRIGIDTGAYSTGVLTAIRIDDDGIEMIQAHG